MKPKCTKCSRKACCQENTLCVVHFATQNYKAFHEKNRRVVPIALAKDKRRHTQELFNKMEEERKAIVRG